MTLNELKLLNSVNDLIKVEDLSDTKDRTLLYGYTCSRKTFHVYLKNNEIHVILYNEDYDEKNVKPKNMRELFIKTNCDYIPDKRLYPEACDFDFCKLLKEKDISLPFTVFNTDRPIQDFYGFTLEDM